MKSENLETIMPHESVNIDTKQKEQLQQIFNYTRHELPVSEERILHPMLASCKVSVAIPAYQEGTQILTALEFLSRQEDVQKDEYEIIVNVNNRVNPDSKTRELNKLTVQVLRSLEDHTIDIGFLSGEQKQLVEKIRSSGVVIHCIDKTSLGKELKPVTALDFTETGPMQPRKRLMDEISERFALTGKADGIIASLDADTKVNPKWIRQMIDSFANGHIQLLAGERRDGLDIDETGAVIDEIGVMHKMFDDWNSPERQADEVLGEFSNIETQTERAEIIVMSHLIDAYNYAREKQDTLQKVTGDVLENFRGGSGKAFKVGAYVSYPREIIEMMDVSIDELPEGLRKDTCVYVGGAKDEEHTATAPGSPVEALAIYPETRIRSWQLTSPDSKNPYQDFRNLHNPYGSSGKELAYAVTAVLKRKLPTADIMGTIRNKTVSIIEALRTYGKQNPEGRVANPDRYFLEVLSSAVAESTADEKHMLEQRVIQIFDGKAVSGMSETVSYAEASEKYERFFKFS